MEVVVVDDGSTDATRERAEALAAADERVCVVVHPANRGYGAAVRSGIEAARMPWILLTDGDRQFDLAELVGLLPLASGHDLVAGLPHRSPGRARPPRRRARVELAHAADVRLRGDGRRLRVQARRAPARSAGSS